MNHEKESAEMVRAEIDSLIMRDFASNRTFGALSPDVQKKMIELERKIEKGEDMTDIKVELDGKQLGFAFEKNIKVLHRPLTEASPDKLIDEAIPNDKIEHVKYVAGLRSQPEVKSDVTYEDEAPRNAKLAGTPLKEVWYLDIGGIKEKKQEEFLKSIIQAEKRHAALEGLRENFVMEEKEMSKVVSDHDPVNSPKHYKGKTGKIESIDVIEEFGLNFCRGNTVKYILRAPNKNNELEDLKKARWYLDREIKTLEESLKK